MKFTYNQSFFSKYTLIINDDDTVFLSNNNYSAKDGLCNVPFILPFLKDRGLTVENFTGLKEYLEEDN